MKVRSCCKWLGLLLASVALGCGANTDGPLDEVRAVTVNSLSEDLSMIGIGDPPPVTKSLVTVGSAPNQILMRGKEALVLSSTSNSLQVIDPETWMVVREYSLGEGCNPYLMALAQDDLLLVTCWLSDELLLVDPDVDMAEETVLKRLPMPEGTDLKPANPDATCHARPQGVAVVDNEAYVTLTNLGDDFMVCGPGLVVVVDVAAWTKDKIIELPNTNCGFTYAYSGKIYASCSAGFDGTGSIEVIDPTTRDVSCSIPTGGAPARIWIDEQGNGWAGDQLEGQVLRFDPSTCKAGDPVLLCPSDFDAGIFNFIADVASDGRGKVYAACFATDEVCVFMANGDGSDATCYQVGDGPQALLVVQR